MEIEFVNHASIIYRHDDLRLIADPWIEGTVFQNSWAHLAKTVFAYDDFRDITHIWFSHEHPDHFFPPNIKKIPAEIRENITVLFKQTLDGKVAAFCRKLGFKEVIELPLDRWHPLTEDVRLLCHAHHDDTTLVFDNGEQTIVNTNDCALDSVDKVRRLNELIGGSVDVLLTQFSYACYVGETFAQRRRHALRHYDQMTVQIEHLAPKYLIPFASYVYFCHEDNFYMNDAINKVDEVHDHFSRRSAAQPVVLYSGEVWTVGEPHDSQSAIDRYMADYDRADKPLIYTQTVDEKALHESAANFHTRLSENVAYLKLLRALPVIDALRVYVTDHGKAYQLDVSSFRELPDVDQSQCGISMSSETLEFCLNFDYGFNTTAVSGKFHVIHPGGYKTFRALTSLSDAMNHGRVTWVELFKGVQRRIGRRLKLLRKSA